MSTYEPVNQALFDPWLKLREKTAVRNHVQEVAHCYNQMHRLAVAQYNRLKDLPKTKQDTLQTLLMIAEFTSNKAAPLWEKLSALDAEISAENERLQNG